VKKLSQKVGREFRQTNFFYICKNCELNCCKEAKPPITPNRRAIIETYLETAGINIENLFEKHAYTFPKEYEDGYCVFLDRSTRKCKIHLVKPETCVSGPVTFDINLKTRKIEWFLKMEKICPLAGIIRKDKETFLNHVMSAKRELLTLVRDLDAQELSTILRIDEPETFKIGEDQLDPEVLAKLRPPSQQ